MVFSLLSTTIESMPRKPKQITCSAEQLAKLEGIARSQTQEARLVRRAKIILDLTKQRPIKAISDKFDVRPNTVIDLRARFESEGIDGLSDRDRSGRPVQYGPEFRKRVLKLLEQPPPGGQAAWDGPSVAARLEVSEDAVWRLLRTEGICLSRQRSWCVSTDPEFVTKAADIVGLYLNPPEKALVISVDEKPSMQVLQRKRGYVLTGNQKIVRGFQSTYKRHGTLNLFAALNVATGEIKGKTTQTKKRPDFQQFMDDVTEEYADQEIHVILDNYSSHKKNDAWLKKHPNVHFHFTPTSASWLNQVEIWFGIFSRKVLRGASHESQDQLAKSIEEYIKAYNPSAKPFVWRKREVKGSQLRNTIVNLCN